MFSTAWGGTTQPLSRDERARLPNQHWYPILIPDPIGPLYLAPGRVSCRLRWDTHGFEHWISFAGLGDAHYIIRAFLAHETAIIRTDGILAVRWQNSALHMPNYRVVVERTVIILA